MEMMVVFARGLWKILSLFYDQRLGQSSHDLFSSDVSVGFQSLASFRRQLLPNSQVITSWHDPPPSHRRWSRECGST